MIYWKGNKEKKESWLFARLLFSVTQFFQLGVCTKESWCSEPVQMYVKENILFCKWKIQNSHFYYEAI